MNVMDPGRQKPRSSFVAAIRKASRAAQTQPMHRRMAASEVHARIHRQLRPGDAIGSGKRHKLVLLKSDMFALLLKPGPRAPTPLDTT